jgi:hypothetical protein
MIPRAFRRVASASAVLLLVTVMACSLSGCGNSFSQFYSGKTLTQLRAEGVLPADPEGSPKVYRVADLPTALDERLQEGWVMMGTSSWNGPVEWSDETKLAGEHAKQIGASLVLWGWRPAGSRTASIPVTTPTTSTSYTSGTVYSGGSSASYTGTSTNYGTQTSFQAISVPRYDYEAVFLYRSAGPSVFGVYLGRLTPADQEKAGTLSGAIIRIVVKDSPAAKGGLLPGDVIVRIGERAIADDNDIQGAIDLYRSHLVEIELYRRGDLLKRSVQFGGASASAKEANPGTPTTSVGGS